FVEQAPDREHPCKRPIGVDDRQMPDMFFVHELQRVVSCGGAMDRDNGRRHDVSNAEFLRVELLENDAIHQIAFAEDSHQPIVVDYGYRPNVLLMHGPHRIQNTCPPAYRHERRSRYSQKTHTTPPTCFAMAILVTRSVLRATFSLRHQVVEDLAEAREMHQKGLEIFAIDG